MEQYYSVLQFECYMGIAYIMQTKINLKKVFSLGFFVSICLFFAGCSSNINERIDDLEECISGVEYDLQEKIGELEEKINELESEMEDIKFKLNI